MADAPPSPRRCRGRPPLDPDADPDSPSTMLAVRIAAADYDRICHAARVSRLTMAEWVRRRLLRSSVP